MRLITPFLAAALAGGLGAACAPTPEYLRPSENAVAVESDGAPVAVYDIDTSAGRLGQARFWAKPGAYESGGQTRVHLVAQIDNSSPSHSLAMDLGKVWLDAIQVDDQLLGRIPLEAVSGSGVAGPSSIARVDLYFLLPKGIDPHDVDGLSLHWTVNADGQPVLSQFTPFTEDHLREAYATYGYPSYGYYYGGPFYDPFYDPFYYPYYGSFAFGFSYPYSVSYYRPHGHDRGYSGAPAHHKATRPMQAQAGHASPSAAMPAPSPQAARPSPPAMRPSPPPLRAPAMKPSPAPMRAQPGPAVHMPRTR